MTAKRSAEKNRPASQVVADDLRTAIEEGRYPPGSRLPSYRQLVAERGIALNTAREAVRLLEREGLVVIHHGKGAYVRELDEPIPSDVQIRDASAALDELRRDLRRRIDDLAALEQRVATIADRLRGLSQ